MAIGQVRRLGLELFLFLRWIVPCPTWACHLSGFCSSVSGYLPRPAPQVSTRVQRPWGSSREVEIPWIRIAPQVSERKDGWCSCQPRQWQTALYCLVNMWLLVVPELCPLLYIMNLILKPHSDPPGSMLGAAAVRDGHSLVGGSFKLLSSAAAQGPLLGSAARAQTHIIHWNSQQPQC